MNQTLLTFPTSDQSYPIINPATAEIIATVPAMENSLLKIGNKKRLPLL